MSTATTSVAATSSVAAVGPTRSRRERVASTSATADAAAAVTTSGTIPADTGSPSLARAAADRMLNRPPAKTLKATKYPKRVRSRRKTVPRPSQAATPNAPARYQLRYSGSLQPKAEPRYSVPAPMPYQTSPIVHTSWYGCRRRSHWAKTMAAKMNDSAELANGRRTLGST